MTSGTFAREQLETLAQSGWTACPSVREAVRQAGLSIPDRDYLRAHVDAGLWERAGHAVHALAARFAHERFGDQAVFGLLLVPDPGRLDTRRPMPPDVRRDQLGKPTGDFFDDRLPAGRSPVAAGQDWTLVATIVGPAGVFMGSYHEIRDTPASEFTVEGVDTRETMVRQLWGARVLQSGSQPPDCNVPKPWTYTLFAGEQLVEGQAESGTVLHGCVRFRLGRPERRIASGRVCPAIVLGRDGCS